MSAEPDVDYSAGWRDLRRRYLYSVLCGFVGVPAFLVALNRFGIIAQYVGLPFLITGFVVATRCSGFPCPRCKKKYFMLASWGGSNMYRTTCPHCGLRKWSRDGT